MRTALANCTLPWGGTIASGLNIKAYQAATVPYGNTCQSEQRSCSAGTLSGAYAYATCTVAPPSECALPWGGTLANNTTLTAYTSSTVAYGHTCAEVQTTVSCTSGPPPLKWRHSRQLLRQPPQDANYAGVSLLLNGQALTDESGNTPISTSAVTSANDYVSGPSALYLANTPLTRGNGPFNFGTGDFTLTSQESPVL